MLEINQAAEIIEQAADKDASIIFGFSTKEDMRDELRITVIATGFESKNDDGPMSIFDKIGAKDNGASQNEVHKSSIDTDFPIPDFLSPKS